MSEGGTPIGSNFDLVVCSLEAWDDVWRRNQFFVAELMKAKPAMKVLFVEPAVDVPFELLKRRLPAATGLRQVKGEGSLWALRPRKVFPRVLAGDAVDRGHSKRVATIAARLGLRSPVLWVNDAMYAPLATQTGWPVVYDITDDWLLAGGPGRALDRLTQADAQLVDSSDEVVVVSESLLASRGANRPVHVIGCAVEVDKFRQPRPRPADLPPGPVAVYVGTQHDVRLDVHLCVETAKAIAPAKLVFIGPNCLEPRSTRALAHGGCVLLGPRAYEDVPAYYQHADLVVVPHQVNPFTESLDPIKGYECLAVGRPTLVTPVAGMRELGPPIEVCTAEAFAARAKELVGAKLPSRPGRPPTWADRAEAFGQVLESAWHKKQVAS